MERLSEQIGYHPAKRAALSLLKPFQIAKDGPIDIERGPRHDDLMISGFASDVKPHRCGWRQKWAADNRPPAPPQPSADRRHDQSTRSRPAASSSLPGPSFLRMVLACEEDGVDRGRVHTSEDDRLTTDAAKRRPQRRLVERPGFADELEELRAGGAISRIDLPERRSEHLDGHMVFELAAAIRAGERRKRHGGKSAGAAPQARGFFVLFGRRLELDPPVRPIHDGVEGGGERAPLLR